MIRTKKELEIFLSKLKDFENPKLELEQYEAESTIAAELIWLAYMNGDIQGKVIADLGAGTGVLGIGCLLLGAKKVYFVEIDKDVIEILKENLKKIEKSNYEIYNIDVINFDKKVDVVVMNPPYGFQSKELDKFLMKSIVISNNIYSIIPKNKADYIKGFYVDNGYTIRFSIERKMIIRRKFLFHEKDKIRVDVLLVNFFRPQ